MSARMRLYSLSPSLFQRPKYTILTQRLATQLFKKYGNYSAGDEPWKKYGRANDWNIDLIPKFLMSSGELTNILVSTDVTRYLEFKQVAGSYVQQGSSSKATVAKVPSDAGEALKSPLMGIFEKRRMKSFIEWVGTFDAKDTATHKGQWPPFLRHMRCRTPRATH